MTDVLPTVYLVRHGETAWSLAGRHTGRTDIPLTERGEKEARQLGERLHGKHFNAIWTSPSQRAARTCDLAGFGDGAKVDPDLMEWDYGRYEGLLSKQIREERPDWELFRDGCPGGESPAQITERADRVVSRLRGVEGDVLLFSSGHFLRTLAARWLSLELTAISKYLALGTVSVSALGYEKQITRPVIQLWNEIC